MSDVKQADGVTVNIPRHALLAAGGMALIGLGLAAGVMLRSPSSASTNTASTDHPPALMQSPSQPALQAAQAAPEAPAAQSTHATASQGKRKPEPVRQDTALSNDSATRPVTPEVQARPAVVCAHCGVIEAVRPVQQKGQGTGLGAVAGGVLGGVVGNQMGKGSGNTALTVLGALGGGFAGNEVEKHTRTVTVYEVRVRMDDGSTRTFTQRSQPAPGTRVEVDGRGFHTVDARSDSGPSSIQTSTSGPY